MLRVANGARHTNLLVRIEGAARLHPLWQAHPVSLEELVVAYLERAESTTTATAGAGR